MKSDSLACLRSWPSLAVCTCALGCQLDLPEVVHDEPIQDAGVEAETGLSESGPETESGLEAADDVANEVLPEADALSCEAGTQECDSDSTNGCEDLSSDPLHCGRCGHDCLGGECVAGVCQPVLLASGIQKPFALIKDADYIYGTGDDTAGQVWKVPVHDCTTPSICASVLTNTGAKYQDIAQDIEAVFFTDRSAGRVLRLSKMGGDPCDLATNQQDPVGVAVDDSYVYWTTRSGNRILRADKDCSTADPPEVVVPSTPAPQLLLLDSTGLYWTSMTGGLLSWASADGSSSEPVWSGISPGDFMFGLAMDDTWVYWRDGEQYTTGGQSGRLVRARRDRSGGFEVLAENQGRPRYMDLDDTHIYWTADDAVHRMAKADVGTVEVMAAGFPGVHGIVVDEVAVYFCTYGTGEVFRIAK